MPLKAKFSGTCSGCGARFAPGDSIGYNRESKSVTSCPSCPGARSAVEGAPAASADLLKYRLRVQRQTYRNEESGYTIAKCVFDEDGKHSIDWTYTPFADDNNPYGHQREQVFSVVGNIGHVQSGDTIDALGTWENSKYGWQLKAGAAVPVVGHNEQAIRAYLARFPQVGPRRAKDLVQKCGGRVGILAALDGKDYTTLAQVDGITIERAKAIIESYETDTALRECMLWLSELGISSQMIADILDEWGAGATVILKDNPYALMDIKHIGFVRADDVARAQFKLEKHDPRRSAAAVLHILGAVESEGHTWINYTELTFEPEKCDPLEF